MLHVKTMINARTDGRECKIHLEHLPDGGFGGARNLINATAIIRICCFKMTYVGIYGTSSSYDVYGMSVVM